MTDTEIVDWIADHSSVVDFWCCRSKGEDLYVAEWTEGLQAEKLARHSAPTFRGLIEKVSRERARPGARPLWNTTGST